MCTDLAWGTPKDSSIFNEDRPDNDSDGNYPEVNGSDGDTDTDSDIHSCTPAEADMVVMVSEKVKKINRTTKRSMSTIDEVRDMTLELLEKMAKIEEVVDKIQDGTTKAQNMVGKVEEKLDHNHTLVSNRLEMNTELINDLEQAMTYSTKGKLWKVPRTRNKTSSRVVGKSRRPEEIRTRRRIEKGRS